MKQVFRATAKYWVQEDGALIVIGLGGSTFFLWAGVTWLGVLMALVLLASLPRIYEIWISRLEMNEDGIASIDRKSTITVRWDEIVSIQLIEIHQQPRKLLEIFTSSNSANYIRIPIYHLDYREIWRLVQRYAPATALGEDAYRKLPGYQEAMAETRKRLAETKTPLTVSISWIAKAACWGTAVGMAVGAIALRDSIFGMLLSLFFGSLGVWGILTIGKITMDHEAITYRTPVRHYQIKWDEITRIEADVYGAMAFYGENKYLVVPGPGWWSGKDKAELQTFLSSTIELRQIKIESKGIILKSARNVRIG